MKPEDKKIVRIGVNSYKVLIVGDANYEYIRLMYSLGYGGAKTIEEADVVLFTGGEDVDPKLYGEEALKTTMFNRARDDREMEIYAKAVKLGKPMVGICRGGQFLNVANDGKMWQHVDGHTGDHLMFVIDDKGNTIRDLNVTSTHHQMMRPTKEAVILAIAARARTLVSFKMTEERQKPVLEDVEVVWYPKTGCLCFQPHPEFRSAGAMLKDYFNECLDNFVLPFLLQKDKAA